MKDGISLNSNTVKSFLMIGQSNMAGRGNFGEVEPIHNPMCYMLRMGRWQFMSEPINTDRSIFHGEYRSGVGLAASFADETAKALGCKVGLIPCADGGTSISQWQPGGLLFDHAVMMAKLAMRTSDLAGILWHQGESDCGNFDGVEYRKCFLNTMTALRRELDAEDVPLIIGEISENITEDWNMADGIHQMNRLLRGLKDELPSCEIVSVDGLELKADGIHFNSASYRELGRRYFEKYMCLLQRR